MSRHDISNEKWAIIGPLLAKDSTETRGRKRKDDRLMFNGILWILKTGGIYLLNLGPGKLFINDFFSGQDLKYGITF